MHKFEEQTTGYWQVNSALYSNSAEEPVMGNTTESVDVDVDVRTAYNQWTQFESFPQFMDGVDEIRQFDETHTHWKTSIGDVKREFDAIITEQQPDERVAWKSVDGTSHAGVIKFHRLGDNQTRVTAQMEIEPEGIAETVADKTGIISRRMKADMVSFKEFIESRGGDETGAWRGDIA
jgi:uncharacterized membrane protein